MAEWKSLAVFSIQYRNFTGSDAICNYFFHFLPDRITLDIR